MVITVVLTYEHLVLDSELSTCSAWPFLDYWPQLLYTRGVLVGISFPSLLLPFLVFLLKFCFVTTWYGMLANVALDYFRPISRHGNTLICTCFKLSHLSPLNLLGNTPNFVQVKGICDLNQKVLRVREHCIHAKLLSSL